MTQTATNGRIVYDLVAPELLTQYVRQWDQEVLRPQNNDSLEQFVPNLNVMDLEYRVRRGARNLVDAAEYRNWDTPARMTGRAGTQFVRGSLGPVSRQIPMGEEEFLRTRQLLSNDDDPIIQAIYDDAENMIRAVQDRIELARGDIIDDGKLTLNENGLSLEADWARDSSMSVSSGTVWTNTGASTPLTDLLAWTQAYRDFNGTDPGMMVMSKVRIANLALSAEIRSYAAAGGSTPVRINRATLDDIFSVEGLPPIFLYDRFTRIDGTKTTVLPQTKIYLMPPQGDEAGNTFYGVTAEALKFVGQNRMVAEDAPGIVALVTETEHPVATYTVGTAVAMPVLPNASLILDASVA